MLLNDHGRHVRDFMSRELESVVECYIGPGTSMAAKAGAVGAMEIAAAYLLVCAYGNMLTPESAARAIGDMSERIADHVGAIMGAIDRKRGRMRPEWQPQPPELRR
jgi:hypothetical protein